MPFSNRVVIALLRSPLHRLLSGSTAVVTYRGRRSGRAIETPVQWAGDVHELVIFVARPDAKQWWRNFVEDHDLEVLVRGERLAMVGRAVRGATDPAEAARLLDAYLARFPKAASFVASTEGERDLSGVVLVRARPASERP